MFALPGTVAARLGWWSLLALVLAALVAAAIMLSFAEVASRFVSAGGPYLYAQAAFGRFVGLQMGWMAYFVRTLSAAVQVNLLTTYFAEVWSPANTPGGRAFLGALLLGILCAVNIRGVAAGTGMSNVFAVIKLAPLLALGAFGMAWLFGGFAVTHVAPTALTPSGWLNVLLLLMFSYGGFEASTIPLGEAKDPQRDAPFSLLTGLAIVVILYMVVQVAVLVALPDPNVSDRPLAEVARVFLGRPGATMMTVAAVISVYGWGAGAMLAVPRLTFAMAERGDLPSWVGRVHARFRTPYISILLYAGLTYVLSLQGDLLKNISLSTVSRLLTYGLVCAALLALRRKDGPGSEHPPAKFRAPLGILMPAVGLLASLVLVTRMTPREGVWLLAIVGVALVHWLAVKDRTP